MIKLYFAPRTRALSVQSITPKALCATAQGCRVAATLGPQSILRSTLKGLC